MNGTTVWSCDTDCVQMASKQPNVEFSSHIFQFTRLHGVAVMQGLTFRDSVFTLVKSTRWYVLSGTGFLVAHQLYIGNVMRKYQIGKSSPHALWKHLSFQCLGVIVALNGKRASMILEPTKNKLKQWRVIEKSVNKCIFFPRYFEIITKWMQITDRQICENQIVTFKQSHIRDYFF